MTVDYTVRLSDIVLVIGGIVSFLVMFQRTTLILNQLVKRVDKIEGKQDKHETWLVQMRAKLGFDNSPRAATSR